jgi:CHASE3 domain sensor protein
MGEVVNLYRRATMDEVAMAFILEMEAEIDFYRDAIEEVIAELSESKPGTTQRRAIIKLGKALEGPEDDRRK